MLALDGSQFNLLISLAAGFVTFFASCLLPLVPTYLAYLSGVSLQEETNTQQRWSIFKVSLFFVLGFVSIFVILGMLLRSLYVQVGWLRTVMQRLGGLLFMVLGLFMLGAFKSQFLNQERKIDVHGFLSQQKNIHAFLTGMAFGFGWTPCIGPVLALIFYHAAQSASPLLGLLHLISFGVGLGIPFILIALFFETLVPWLKKHSRLSLYLTKLAGVFILVSGVMMMWGQIGTLSIKIWHFLGFNPLSK